MPYQWIEPELFLTYRRVPVYRTYRHGEIGKGHFEYTFTLSPFCGEEECACPGGAVCDNVFDVRELSTWASISIERNPLTRIRRAIRAAIEMGLLPPIKKTGSCN